ncbi:MAG TPA: hypothetical protein VMW65_11485, partial [Chloroflexota bacterium]|nr:hypothetical protein [Chloroflexota bacterium]
MVIYVPADAPPSDPLLELREAGGQLTIRLKTLVQQALKGQMTESRLDEVGKRARTLAEAEAALDGDSSSDPRLVAALGTSDTRRMIIAAVSGERDAQIEASGAWDDVGVLLARTVGSAVAGHGEEFRQATLRHLLLAELIDHLGELGEGVAPAWEPPTDTQRRSATEVLKTWRGDREGIKTYVPLCLAADRELGLEGLAWTQSLSDLDSLPTIEAVAIREGLRRLGARDYTGAAELARGRLAHSLWAGDASTIAGVPEWSSRWEVLAATADLRNALNTERLPAGGASAILSWYAQSGWKVDRAHRHLETT